MAVGMNKGMKLTFGKERSEAEEWKHEGESFSFFLLLVPSTEPDQVEAEENFSLGKQFLARTQQEKLFSSLKDQIKKHF